MGTVTQRRPPSRQRGRTVLFGAGSTVATIAVFVAALFLMQDDTGNAGEQALLSVWAFLIVGAVAMLIASVTASDRWRPFIIGGACGFLLGTVLLAALAMWALSTADLSG